jgi:hypothetical protein
MGFQQRVWNIWKEPDKSVRQLGDPEYHKPFYELTTHDHMATEEKAAKDDERRELRKELQELIDKLLLIIQLEVE